MSRAMPIVLATFGTICLMASAVNADPIINNTHSGSFPATITGTLPNQATALEEAFTLPSTTNLMITTTSYATGGFEPNLLLFNSMGDFVTSGNPFGSPDPGTGVVGDMQLTDATLPAGEYTLALTDFLLNQSLTATNLSDGFTQNYGSGTNFVDANGNDRTGNYSLTIDALAAATPEPSTIWLIAAAVAGMALRGRKLLSGRFEFRRGEQQ